MPAEKLAVTAAETREGVVTFPPSIVSFWAKLLSPAGTSWVTGGATMTAPVVVAAAPASEASSPVLPPWVASTSGLSK